MLKDKAYIQAKGGRAEIQKEPSPCRYYCTAALPMPALTAVDEKSLSQFSILIYCKLILYVISLRDHNF